MSRGKEKESYSLLSLGGVGLSQMKDHAVEGGNHPVILLCGRTGEVTGSQGEGRAALTWMRGKRRRTELSRPCYISPGGIRLGLWGRG